MFFCIFLQEIFIYYFINNAFSGWLMVTLEVIEERVNNTYKLLENIAEDNRQSHKEIIENFDKKYAEIKENSYEKEINKSC